jgi:hypothetical protein
LSLPRVIAVLGFAPRAVLHGCALAQADTPLPARYSSCPDAIVQIQGEIAPIGRSAAVPRSRCQGLERWNGVPICPAVLHALRAGTVGQPAMTVPRSTPQGLERWNGAMNCPAVPHALGAGTVGQPTRIVPRSTPQGLERCARPASLMNCWSSAAPFSLICIPRTRRRVLRRSAPPGSTWRGRHFPQRLCRYRRVKDQHDRHIDQRRHRHGSPAVTYPEPSVSTWPPLRYLYGNSLEGRMRS